MQTLKIILFLQPVIEEPADDIAEKLDNLQIVEATDDDIKIDKVTKFIMISFAMRINKLFEKFRIR